MRDDKITIAPSVVLIGLTAMLSLVAATVVIEPWVRYFALGCAFVEIVTLVALIVAVRLTAAEERE